jgi:hypothetical protein
VDKLWDVLFAIFLGACVLATPAAWVGYRNGQPIDVALTDIVAVRLFDPVVSPDATDPSLAAIESSIPIPLPHPVWQGFLCDDNGVRLTIEFDDDSTLTYGPCRYPPGIVPLYSAVHDVQTFGACRPDCGPEGAAGP